MTAPKLSLNWSDTDGDGRAYKFPWDLSRVPSVTTVLKKENKDDLLGWVAFKTSEWCAANWQMLAERSNQSAIQLARGRYRDYRDERAEVGTGVHEYIEALLTDSWDFPELDGEQMAMVENFHRFTEAYEFNPIQVEATVWNHGFGYAGTLDTLAEVEGPGVKAGLYVIDNKTSAKVYDSHFMQLMALKNADELLTEVPAGTVDAQEYKSPKGEVSYWTKQDMPETDGVLVLHLRADKWGLEQPRSKKHEEAHWRQFKALKSMWDADQAVKDLDKEVF